MNASLWTRHAMPSSGAVICIPVCNEADRIGACLDSFAVQDSAAPFDLVLLLNNCTDATEAVVRDFPAPPNMRLHVEQRWFPPHLANAGHARRVAMQAGRALAGPLGLLMCTDADATVPPDWIRRNEAAIAAGADAVAGRIEMDAQDLARLPARMHRDEADAQLLTTLLDAIDSTADPDAVDPWPRHAEHSGASIAVTAAAYDAAGGIPCIASSEDRAFFAALRRIDARIRHAPDIVVSVSGRLDGRAPGGMAETLRRRLAAPDAFLDDCIEPASDRLCRATLRASLRRLRDAALAGTMAWPDLQSLAAALELGPALLCRLIGSGTFGALWEALEAQRPVLRRRRVPALAVGNEIAAAHRILQDLQPVPLHRGGEAPVPALAAAAAG